MTPMMWLSILLMLSGSVLWISSIHNQTTIIKEAKKRWRTIIYYRISCFYYRTMGDSIF